ncbi:VWA domain-containing protein, partial [bacterium]|nr:VWA domain-containing protein [bacterium]
MRSRFFFLLSSAFLIAGGSGLAQNEPSAGIYIIFDGSGSMWQKLPEQTFKIEAAKQVLQEFVSGDFEGFELALRVYGHRRKGDCRDSELAIPFSSPQTVISQLSSFMNNINPTGKTPITYSFRQALQDFGERSGEIILISDGIETCDEDPCALMREWRESNVRIRVHVVGLGLDEKSRDAMRCISEAAGTEYYDANSASELSDGLRRIQEQAVPASFKLKGFDADGNEMKIKGTLSQGGKKIYDVESHRRYVIEAGEYDVIAGIETRNGHLYHPATKTISVTETGETTARLEVQVPPSVRAKFVQMDQTRTGSLITAYQNGKEAFRFRWKDEVYLDEGSYEFRAKPNPENDLKVIETFAAGEHKEIVFEMAHTVRARFKLVASGSRTWFRQNYELWQNGKKKY